MLILTTLILISCTREDGTLPRIWIDSPREGISLPVDQPVTIYSHAYSGKGVAEVVLSVDGAAYSRTSPGEEGVNFSDFQQEWLPPGEGIYIIQLVAYNSEGERSTPATLSITVGKQVAVEQPPESEMDPPEIEQDPICPPQVTATTNANCRSGPGEVYPVIRTLSSGEMAQVTGRSEDGYWWVIDTPNASGTCWIWEELVSLSTDTCQVAAVKAPLPPQDQDAPPAPQPAVPANGLTLDCRSTQNLVWIPVEDTSGIAGYYVKLEKEISAGNWQVINQWGPVSGKQIEVPVECGVPHRWAVRAEDKAGNFSPWSANSKFTVNLD
ncbi:MAG: SH3 domain-containing protein [Anaerolineales bacterium]|nr:SH3 domain-containing protein [Anaerolineales bacterium]